MKCSGSERPSLLPGVLGGHHRRVERPLGLVEDEHVLGRHKLAAAAVGGHVLLDAADEGLAAAARTAELVLEHLHEGAVARQEDRGRRGPAVAAVHGQVVEPARVRDLEADQGLAGARHPGQQDQAPGARAGRLVDQLRDPGQGGPGRCRGTVDPGQRALLEQQARRLDEAGQRPVRVGGEEPAGADHRCRVADVEPLGELVDGVDAEHVDPRVRADVAARPAEDDSAVDRSARALAMVGAQVAHVAGRLVDVRPLGAGPALELEHQNGAAHEQHDVGPPELERQFVLEDGRVVGRDRVLEEDLADLALQGRDRQVPGADLLGRDLAQEVLQRAADLDGRGRAERLEGRGPAVAGHASGRAGRRVHRIELTRVAGRPAPGRLARRRGGPARRPRRR